LGKTLVAGGKGQFSVDDQIVIIGDIVVGEGTEIADHALLGGHNVFGTGDNGDPAVTSLQQCGYVAQEADTLRYYPTFKICHIANQISSHIELQTITHPYLIQLSEEFQESMCVSIEQNQSMVYIDVATGPGRALLSLQKIGNTVSMHCTGNGKLRLSEYTEEQLDFYIHHKGLPVFTEHTIATKEDLLLELNNIRTNGFAIDNEECELGVRCIACPIRDYTGAIIAGISVTGPASRMTDSTLQKHLTKLKPAALQISNALGWQGFQ
jgi:DNA-binding IclR family transcriptional regulator